MAIDAARMPKRAARFIRHLPSLRQVAIIASQLYGTRVESERKPRATSGRRRLRSEVPERHTRCGSLLPNYHNEIAGGLPMTYNLLIVGHKGQNRSMTVC